MGARLRYGFIAGAWAALALGCPQFESDFVIASDAGTSPLNDSEPPSEGALNGGQDASIDSPSASTSDAATAFVEADDGERSASDGSMHGEFDAAESSTSHTCPSTCDQLSANCGAVADTFCGGQVQCGTCTTGICGGAQPSMCGCPTGQLACGAACVDPMTDSANCGKCGMNCATSSVQGEACQAGLCACPSGTEICAGQQATYCNLVYKACF
jgi:hypothetical protein